MHQHRGPGGLLEFLDAPHMIDVGVGGDDVLCTQVVPGEDCLYALNVIAGVDDHSLSRGFVAHNRAIALEHSNWDDFVDHSVFDFGISIRLTTPLPDLAAL